MNVVVVILAIAVLASLVIAIPVLGGNAFGKKVNGKKFTGSNFSHQSYDKTFVKTKWAEINASFALGGPSHIKNSIIEADKLLDYVLKGKKLPGQTMGDRLKAAKKYFGHYADYDNLWFSHKVRNNIAHESNHDLNSGEAKRAMEYYKKALTILGAL